jgi:hypothetical protein
MNRNTLAALQARWDARDARYALRRARLTEEEIVVVRAARLAEAQSLPPSEQIFGAFVRAKTWFP